MTKLNQAQSDLLAEAAAAGDAGMDTFDKRVAAALIKRGFALSIPIKEGGSRLLITEAGVAANQGDAPANPASEADAVEAEAPPVPKPAEPKGKIGILVGLLRRPDGASVEAMMEATGWQAHSVRGAMSGSVKKAMGLTITSEKTDGGRIYRIGDGAAA